LAGAGDRHSSQLLCRSHESPHTRSTRPPARLIARPAVRLPACRRPPGQCDDPTLTDTRHTHPHQFRRRTNSASLWADLTAKQKSYFEGGLPTFEGKLDTNLRLLGGFSLGLAFLLLPLAVGTLSLFCRRFGSTPGAGTPSPGGGL
jgi:hypothetical protein